MISLNLLVYNFFIAERRTKYFESKPTREEKASTTNDMRVKRRNSALKVMAAITLFLLLILAVVQPVGIRITINGS